MKKENEIIKIDSLINALIRRNINFKYYHKGYVEIEACYSKEGMQFLSSLKNWDFWYDGELKLRLKKM